MPTAIRAAALLLLGAVAGCSPAIESARFQPAPAATRAEDVRVYTTRTPDCAYDELGIVSGPATDLFTSLQQIVDGMRREAARMGGDALIQLRPVERGGSVVPAGGTSSDRAGYLATVVRFPAGCAGP